MLNPIGDVGDDELQLLKLTIAIMAAIVIPVILATFWFTWHYREGNADSSYDPEFHHSSVIHAVTLFVPLLTITALGVLTWIYTHRLDPYQPRACKGDICSGGTEPYEIRAVSLDYKWLFIYPEEGVATINELAAPTNRPVTIRLTSDPMMTSLFIPGLISQIYAMPGMETRANFLATKEAVMDGANAQYSGPSFYHQRFKTHLLTADKFKAWVSNVKSGQAGSTTDKVQSKPKLDQSVYEMLVKRTKDKYPITYFNSVDDGVFAGAVRKYMPHYKMNPLPSPKKVASSNQDQKGH